MTDQGHAECSAYYFFVLESATRSFVKIRLSRSIASHWQFMARLV